MRIFAYLKYWAQLFYIYILPASAFIRDIAKIFPVLEIARFIILFLFKWFPVAPRGIFHLNIEFPRYNMLIEIGQCNESHYKLNENCRMVGVSFCFNSYFKCVFCCLAVFLRTTFHLFS